MDVGQFLIGFDSVDLWVRDNYASIFGYLIILFILNGLKTLSKNYLTKMKKQTYFDDNTTYLFSHVMSWVFNIAMVLVVFQLFGIKLDLFIGLWVLAGGTVIGFASINTIGNAIAGLIIMLSRPYKIGDRLIFQDKIVDVTDLDLIYTTMQTTEEVVLSVPNQLLIESVIQNVSSYEYIRRKISITADYADKSETVERALLEAAKQVEEVLTDPAPFVWITAFQNFSIEYTLNIFIKDVKRMLSIEAKLRKEIMISCEKYGLDLKTPSLIKSIS